MRSLFSCYGGVDRLQLYLDCVYQCGGCTPDKLAGCSAHYVGPSRNGAKCGICVRGYCYNTPPECSPCNQAITCPPPRVEKTQEQLPYVLGMLQNLPKNTQDQKQSKISPSTFRITIQPSVVFYFGVL